MSCNICQSKFSFFTKEVACPGCGFSYCSKCIKYKSNIPDVGVKKVCGRCFNKSKTVEKPVETINSKMDEPPEEPLVPVDIIKKLDQLENPSKPPIVMYKHNNHWDKLKNGLEPADQEIVERLRKLKEEEKQAPSVDEIRRRLALLKDEDPDAHSSNQKINIHEVDTRTDQEKVDDLMQEYLDRLKLSAGSDGTGEIQSRLRALQSEGDVPKHHPSPQAKRSDDVDDDEEHVTKRLLARALAEAALEKKYEQEADKMEEMEIENPPKDLDDEDEEDEEDKPFCTICNETKNLRSCKCCDGDYYCSKCYNEIHND